ncbi:MAG: lysozyme-like domain containing protein [Pseudomonadales bacterium]
MWRSIEGIVDPRLIAFLTAVLLAVLNACASTPPERPDNLCAIFDEKYGWYKDARAAEKRWGLPIPVGMAFIHKESSYVSNARPERDKLLWIIPWTRPSSAYGYAQATNEAWKDYRRATGRRFVERNDIRDALDFVGWYNHRSAKSLGLDKADAYSLYLAYYVGPTGYKRGVWKNEPRIQGYARRVADRAYRYRVQLQRCEEKLKHRGFLWF